MRFRSVCVAALAASVLSASPAFAASRHHVPLPPTDPRHAMAAPFSDVDRLVLTASFVLGQPQLLTMWQAHLAASTLAGLLTPHVTVNTVRQTSPAPWHPSPPPRDA